jgi:hypothetical protein
MPEPHYARIAYEGWAQFQGWKDGDFDDIPTWDRLEPALKDAWEAGIDAAMNAQIPGDAP